MFNFLENQKIAAKLLIPIILITVTSFIVINIIINSQVKSLASSFIIDNIKDNTKGFIKRINARTKFTIEKATLLAKDEKLIKLFYDAQYDENGKKLYNEDGKKLKTPIDKEKADKAFKPFKAYVDKLASDLQQNSGIKKIKIHFHTADVYSFYRCWKTKRLDELSSFRNTLNKIAKDPEHKLVKGFEVGRGGIPVRGIMPIFYNNKYIGSVEYMDDIKGIFKNASVKGLNIGLVLDKKTILGAKRKLDGNSKITDKIYLLASNRGDSYSIEEIHKNPLKELFENGYQKTITRDFKHATYSYEPLKDYSETVVGGVLMGYDKTTINETTSGIIYKMIGISIIVIIIFIIFIIFISKIITKPIYEAKVFFENAATGESDLTIRLNESNSKDEVNQMSIWFNKFIENLQIIVTDISSYSNELLASSAQLRSASDNMDSNIENVNQDVQNLTTLVENVNNENQKISNELKTDVSNDVNNVSNNLIEVRNSFEKVSQNSNDIESMTLSISSAIEQMSTTISEISSNTAEAAQVSNKAKQQGKDTTIVMQKLNESAKSIGDVVELIKDIASQTNLLALNATIEAASAGDAGKGFAVVANEIKNLANQTAEATSKITEQITDIQDNMNEGVSNIDKITTIINTINDINITIASALEEQSVTVSEISSSVNLTLETVKSNTSSIQEVNENISESSSKSENVAISVEKISNKTEESSEKMNDTLNKILNIKESSSGLLDSSKEVNENSNKVEELSNSLNNTISKFKV